MTDFNAPQQSDLNKYLYPRSRYHGSFSPQRLAFNANLQEFSQRIGYICVLETGGKLPPKEAYARIRQQWKKLTNNKKELGIGTSETSSE